MEPKCPVCKNTLEDLGQIEVTKRTDAQGNRTSGQWVWGIGACRNCGVTFLLN
jgi:hypothetical protein